jgi:hypothetical protein
VHHVVQPTPTGSAAASARSNPTRSNPAARSRQCPIAPRYTHTARTEHTQTAKRSDASHPGVGAVLQERRSVPFPAGIEDQDWHDRRTEVSLTDAPCETLVSVFWPSLVKVHVNVNVGGGLARTASLLGDGGDDLGGASRRGLCDRIDRRDRRFSCGEQASEPRGLGSCPGAVEDPEPRGA